MVKRAFDIVVAGILLILLAPVLLVVGAGVLFALGRPVLFRQLRPGLGGKPFVLYKFRTMRPSQPASGTEASDAQRLTRFGAFLRASSLDELPELLNVLRGDMSLVGPRPLLVEYLPHYTPRQARRHDVRPGITGWAQVNGRNGISWERKFELDVWYVENQAFALDLKILWLTLLTVVSASGISQPGHATIDKFRGAGK